MSIFHVWLGDFDFFLYVGRGNGGMIRQS